VANARLGPKTLSRVLDAYETKLEVRAKAKSVRNARCSSAKLLEVMGNVSVHTLTETDIDAFIVARRKEGVRDKTINGDLIILRAALRHAQKVRMVESVPKVHLLKVARRKAIKILSKGDLQQLLLTASKVPDPRLYGILLVAAHTGFRSDEILHLWWRDVDEDQLSISVTSKPGWTSKSHQERTVFVAPAVLQWLGDWRQRAVRTADEDYVFATRSGRPMSTTNVARAVRKVFEDCGLYRPGQNACLHSIRHAAATRMLAKGTDLEVVRDILGHADVATTSLYLHASDERKRGAATALALD